MKIRGQLHAEAVLLGTVSFATGRNTVKILAFLTSKLNEDKRSASR
jgi:hypothetical protein